MILGLNEIRIGIIVYNGFDCRIYNRSRICYYDYISCKYVEFNIYVMCLECFLF